MTHTLAAVFGGCGRERAHTSASSGDLISARAVTGADVRSEGRATAGGGDRDRYKPLCESGLHHEIGTHLQTSAHSILLAEASDL